MERSVGSKKSVYGMLMTVLFYTTGFICGLRTAWLAVHMLVPATLRFIALYYQPYSSSPSPRTPASGGAGFASNLWAGTGDAAGLLFKLVRTAAGHDHFVPIPAPLSTYHVNAATAESTGIPRSPLHRTLALLAFLVGASTLAAYYYFSLFGPPVWTWGKMITIFTAKQRTELRAGATTDSRSTGSSSPPATALATTKTKLNPAAPAFTPTRTPSPAPAHHRLNPTARTFAPRGCATPPSPADSMDSAGPTTPSPSCLPSAFALAAARVARAGTGMGIKSAGGGSAGARLPIGVGKMRVVRPEEVVGERRPDEVFVFF